MNASVLRTSSSPGKFVSGSLFTLLFTLALLLPCQSAMSQTCTGLLNGSFESGFTDWNVGSGTSYGTSTYYVMDGSRSIWIYKGRFASIASVYQDVAAQPDFDYELSFYAGTHVPSYSHQVSLEFYDKNDQLLLSESQEADHDVDGAPVLQAYTVSATAPAGTDYLRVIGTATGDYLKLDGLCLQETPAGSFPVEWLDFSASFDGTSAQLSWATASELNASHFEVERSYDGIGFERVGNVSASGTSTHIQQYRYTDTYGNFTPDYQYFYRLRQIDLDGSYSFSKTIELSVDEGLSISLSTYPTPARDQLQIDWTSMSQGTIRVLSLVGSIIYQKEVGVPETSGHISVDVANWPSGAYFVELSTETNRKTQKIIKY